MADSLLAAPLTLTSQLVNQTNVNIQQTRELLEQAREESVEEQPVNNTQPDQAPVQEAEDTALDSDAAATEARSDNAGDDDDDSAATTEFRGNVVNITA